MQLTEFKIKHEKREKKAFYASDVFKPVLDIYLSFTGVEPTNPPSWYDTLKMEAGKGVEMGMLKVLKDSGFVNEDYDQKTHGHIEIEREEIKINGYIDAITKDGLPIEIKSINNKNLFDIARYENGNPRENYVAQLAVYMDALDKETGYLFVSTIDGLNRFLLECKKIGERKYRCKNTIVDLDIEYKKWHNLYYENVQKSVMPDLFEYTYKIPLEKIDWSKISKTEISKARNGHKVLGDWRISFSPYKDMIVKLQGATLGYTPEEMEIIKNKTKGFSTR